MYYNWNFCADRICCSLLRLSIGHFKLNCRIIPEYSIKTDPSSFEGNKYVSIPFWMTTYVCSTKRGVVWYIIFILTRVHWTCIYYWIFASDGQSCMQSIRKNASIIFSRKLHDSREIESRWATVLGEVRKEASTAKLKLIWASNATSFAAVHTIYQTKM